MGAICFNVVATEAGGAVVFSWLDIPENKVSAMLVDSLLKVPVTQITNALIRFFFEHCENTFMAPEWWEALAKPVKDALALRMTRGGSPLHERFSTCLTNDGFEYDEWGFVETIR